MNEIIMPPTDDVEFFNDIAEKMINEIFGIDDFMISDLSTLSDFALCCAPEGISAHEDLTYEDILDIADGIMIKKFFEIYGIVVSPNDKIVDVCREIANLSSKTVH